MCNVLLPCESGALIWIKERPINNKPSIIEKCYGILFAITGVSDTPPWVGTSQEDEIRGQKERPMHRNNGTQEKGHEFYKDMRFWLIIAMLSAFLVFILVRYP